MAGVGFNPIVNQGQLNRVAGHLVVTDFPQLSANAGYMAKSLMSVAFEGPFVEQIETATGIVPSPKPFVMANVTVNLLRSQNLSNLWIVQAQAQAFLGDVIVFSDSDAFTPIPLTNTAIDNLDPGAFDGMDPTVKITLKGTFYVNAVMWAPLTGPAGSIPV